MLPTLNIFSLFCSHLFYSLLIFVQWVWVNASFYTEVIGVNILIVMFFDFQTTGFCHCSLVSLAKPTSEIDKQIYTRLEERRDGGKAELVCNVTFNNEAHMLRHWGLILLSPCFGEQHGLILVRQQTKESWGFTGHGTSQVCPLYLL